MIVFVLTVGWHTVAWCVVAVRCVRSCRLQGGAVLGLSISSHDADLKRGSTNNRKNLKNMFYCFVFIVATQVLEC